MAGLFPTDTLQEAPVHKIVGWDENKFNQVMAAPSTEKDAAISKALLDTMKAADASVFGDKLGELISVAKGLKPTDFKGSEGFLAKAKAMFVNTKDRLQSKFDSASSQVDKLVAEIDADCVMHTRRITDMDALYLQNMQEHDRIDAQVKDLLAFIVDANAIVSALDPQEDSFAAQRIADFKSKITRAEKHVDNLQRMMLLKKLRAPKIRLMQDNAREQVSTFELAKTTTIPIFKDAFTDYLLLMEQKASAETTQAMSDITNAALIEQANLLQISTEQIAQNSQRSVVDIDTLKHVHTKLLESLDTTARVVEEGKKRRAAERPELERMEKELIERASGH